MRLVQLTEETIPSGTLYADLQDSACGAVAIFEGRVRNHHQGRRVTGLRYDCYRPMAKQILVKIAQEAALRWELPRLGLAHRIGEIPIGEIAVWIGIASAHREAAFAACRFLIEEVKRSVPIWKRETYDDGSQAWVTCLHA